MFTRKVEGCIVPVLEGGPSRTPFFRDMAMAWMSARGGRDMPEDKGKKDASKKKAKPAPAQPQPVPPSKTPGGEKI